MARKPSAEGGGPTRRGHDGFTLVEVLVVVLIIGILAAVALPALVKHRDRADDADAKTNARNVVTALEACHIRMRDYRSCDEPAELGADGSGGLPLGDQPGQVAVTEARATDYVVAARSASADGSRLFFVIKSDAGSPLRTCEPTGGGCDEGAW